MIRNKQTASGKFGMTLIQTALSTLDERCNNPLRCLNGQYHSTAGTVTAKTKSHQGAHYGQQGVIMSIWANKEGTTDWRTTTDKWDNIQSWAHNLQFINHRIKVPQPKLVRGNPSCVNIISNHRNIRGRSPNQWNKDVTPVGFCRICGSSWLST